MKTLHRETWVLPGPVFLDTQYGGGVSHFLEHLICRAVKYDSPISLSTGYGFSAHTYPTVIILRQVQTGIESEKYFTPSKALSSAIATPQWSAFMEQKQGLIEEVSTIEHRLPQPISYYEKSYGPLMASGKVSDFERITLSALQEAHTALLAYPHIKFSQEKKYDSCTPGWDHSTVEVYDKTHTSHALSEATYSLAHQLYLENKKFAHMHPSSTDIFTPEQYPLILPAALAKAKTLRRSHTEQNLEHSYAYLGTAALLSANQCCS